MGTGIDYGRGTTNIDLTTGIRYGVISQHSLQCDALSEIYDNGDNLSHRVAIEQAKDEIRDAIKTVLDDLGVLPYGSNPDRKPKYIDNVVNQIWEEIEQDWNDGYDEQDDTYRYEHDGYILETSSLGIYVIKSPYVTRTAFCSPCCPGAGDLDSPDQDGTLTYCLGPDWFDDEEAPYPISRADGELTMIVGQGQETRS